MLLVKGGILMMRLFFAVILGVLVTWSPAYGLKDYKRSMPKKVNSYLSEGVVIGGIAGTGFTLREVRRKFGAKSKMERVVLDLGDENGEPIKGSPAYYHVEVDQKKSRVIMDLSQVQRSKMTEKQLRNVFMGSPYLALDSITYDPEDGATNLTLRMKRPIKVEIFSPNDAKKNGRIILDVSPVEMDRPSSAPTGKKKG